MLSLSLPLPAARATRQLRRMAYFWVASALPRRSVPLKLIPARSRSPRESLPGIQLAELSSLQRPLAPAHTLALSSSRESALSTSIAYGTSPDLSLSSRAYTTAVDTSTEPLIVAVGWLGAKRRPFSKYKQLWQSLGFTKVLTARPPMTSIMVPAAGQLLAAKFTHKLIQAARAHPNAPILVHLFSGGGFIFMGWVFQLLDDELQGPESQAVRDRVRGVIFDSSPADVTADVSSRALIAAALGRPADGIEQEFPWLVKPATAVVEGYFRLPFIRDALLGMETAWLRQAPACPKLFLYSDADVLIEPGVVEDFMQQQAANGSPTYSYKWHDSAHVDHYRKYPEEYKQQLQQFVQAVLGQQGQAAGAAGDDMV